jgi:nucleotide-binding universal stress UspA family protein/nitroimidazol reductase NimA-like FMN-containing flavoprotein (pyridoxamine 5'-phosphate oxidase superfamily)
VVVGVDGSDAGQAALQRAAEEAGLRGAALHVVHVWQYPVALALPGYAVPMPAGEFEEEAEQVLEDALADAALDGSLEVARQTACGAAAQVLCQAAEGAELLVVGTRGHNRFTGLFLGSVSQYLAVHAPCPVLVVHGPREHTASEATAAAELLSSTAPVSSTAYDGASETAALIDIPEDECLALLASQRVGRLVVVRGGDPEAYPVNYVLDGRTVALRTDPGLLLDWATLGHVAFEVDRVDEEVHEGWSVVVHGIGQDVTDAMDRWSERVRSRDVVPWAGGERRHWIAIARPRFTGRRIVHQPQATDDTLAPASPS